jgi:hypothetical protein
LATLTITLELFLKSLSQRLQHHAARAEEIKNVAEGLLNNPQVRVQFQELAAMPELIAYVAHLVQQDAVQPTEQPTVETAVQAAMQAVTQANVKKAVQAAILPLQPMQQAMQPMQQAMQQAMQPMQQAMQQAMQPMQPMLQAMLPMQAAQAAAQAAKEDAGMYLA